MHTGDDGTWLLVNVFERECDYFRDDKLLDFFENVEEIAWTRPLKYWKVARPDRPKSLSTVPYKSTKTI